MTMDAMNITTERKLPKTENVTIVSAKQFSPLTSIEKGLGQLYETGLSAWPISEWVALGQDVF